ncbi:MAG: DUF2848 family protein [Firmicutes bacterium]|nr:DUF2848 family protein [Bacillota bacterium]
MLFVSDGKTLDIDTSRVINAGYAGCDQDVVKAHIDELAAIGVSVPKRVPTFYPVPSMQLTQGGSIQVGHGKTSAEVEYVFIRSGEKAYITVGSDHSDRWLESFSVSAAKQICPNVVASELWDYDTVKDHLDLLILRCRVLKDGVWTLYQEGPVTAILPPEKLTELGRGVVPEEGDMVLYSGTIPTIGEIYFGSRWRISLTDGLLGRTIETEYSVEVLPESIE